MNDTRQIVTGTYAFQPPYRETQRRPAPRPPIPLHCVRVAGETGLPLFHAYALPEGEKPSCVVTEGTK